MIDPQLAKVLLRSQELGLLGPGPIETHVDQAMAMTKLIPLEARTADLGSGGGVPGLVLATHRPDIRLICIDGSARRCSFLRWAIRELELEVGVLEGRAEVIGHRAELRGSFDVVVARSFGRPGVTAECAAGLLRTGGVLVVCEPPESAATLERWDCDGLAILGLGPASVASEVGYHFAVLHQMAPLDAQFPRPNGIPAKSPIF